MKVVRLHGPGDLRVADEPEPTVGDGQRLVRVTAVGICGSDLHWFGHGGIGDAVVERPLVVGHEMAGVIEDGPDAGLRVALDPAVSCGACAACLDGDPNLCERMVFAGHGDQDGGLRELLAWPADLLHPLPDTIGDVDGAMLEPLGVALHAVDLSHLRLGMRVLVVGCGPIGLLVVQLAKLAGASAVVALEPLEHRREAALRMGADAAIGDEQSLRSAVDEITAGRGFDLAFEVTNSGGAPQTAMLGVRGGARVVLAGIPDEDRTWFRASLARRKGLTLVMVRRMKDTYPRAIRLVEQGAVDVRSLVTGLHPLEQASAAFDEASRRAGLKVVIEPSSSAR